MSLARLAGFPLAAAALAYGLSFGIVVGFACVLVALVAALAPEGLVRVGASTVLASTALAQLTAEFSWPFAWGVRWAFFAVLIASATSYVQWRVADL
ncbi:MAG: hypothetical protein ACJ76I_03775 [Gaiellaceae bacterium]